MTRVAILPILTETGDVSYHALTGDKRSQGKTAGEALDALTVQLSEDEAGAIIIVQTLQPDAFFDTFQQQRLAELMKKWRLARDKGETLPVKEQSELDELVETELYASAGRINALANELKE